MEKYALSYTFHVVMSNVARFLQCKNTMCPIWAAIDLQRFAEKLVSLAEDFMLIYFNWLFDISVTSYVGSMWCVLAWYD